MDYVTKLKETLDRLTAAYENAEKEIEKDFPGVNPFDVRDSTGRFILLDALTTLTNVLATMALVDPPKPEYPRRPMRTGLRYGYGAGIRGGEEGEKGRVSSDQ